MADQDLGQSTSSHSKDLRNRIFFTIFILCIYDLVHMFLWPIDPVALQEVMSSPKGLLGMFNVFSGGAVQRMAIFALELCHIFLIIVQLLTGVSILKI